MSYTKKRILRRRILKVVLILVLFILILKSGTKQPSLW